METIIRAVEVVSETLNRLDGIEDGILRSPLSFLSSLKGLPFHRKALRRYGKGCKLVSGIDKLTQTGEMIEDMTR